MVCHMIHRVMRLIIASAIIGVTITVGGVAQARTSEEIVIAIGTQHALAIPSLASWYQLQPSVLHQLLGSISGYLGLIELHR